MRIRTIHSLMPESAWTPPGIRNFHPGLTVADLKALIKNWPEVNDDGEPTEVWIRDTYEGMEVSSSAKAVCPLNLRQLEDGSFTADLLFE
jgi:hypothetical protein